MAIDNVASIVSAVTSATGTTPTPGATTTTTSKASIAQNFDSFLMLLTTQLKNQNPLEPLDTNQFTQQLVQFAQVEQQINMNTQLTTLIAMQKATQSTQAMSFLGSTATVDGATTKLNNGQANWSFSSEKPATATVTIKSASGVTAYSGSFSLNSGLQQFTWDGRGNNGIAWPAGDYTISITAKDATGNNVAVSTEISGTVDSVDLTKNPPVLMINGKDYTVDKIKSVVRPGN